MPYSTNAEGWFKTSRFTPVPDHRVIIVDNPNVIKHNNDTRVLITLQCEPNALKNHREAYIRNHAQYDIILTYDDDVLRECKNARLCLSPAHTWINQELYTSIDTSQKKVGISSITGSKNLGTPGHALRQLFYMNQLSLPSYFVWFRSSIGQLLPDIHGNPVIGPELSDKKSLFLDYQFSLVIENSRQKNYFTEKLIDCLITKTIPIYWGCPNISDWFDTRGWIILESESLSELRQKTGVMPTYNDYRESIEANYQTVLSNFTDFYEIIQRAINLGLDTRAPGE
jgi:hypothetical protein